jgi:hypothetical protein
MLKFLFWTTIFLVIGELILHYQLEVPFVTTWLGQLPGDFFVKKENIIYYFPIASAGFIGLVIAVFSFLITPRSKPKNPK